MGMERVERGSRRLESMDELTKLMNHVTMSQQGTRYRNGRESNYAETTNKEYGIEPAVSIRLHWRFRAFRF